MLAYPSLLEAPQETAREERGSVYTTFEKYLLFPYWRQYSIYAIKYQAVFNKNHPTNSGDFCLSRSRERIPFSILFRSMCRSFPTVRRRLGAASPLLFSISCPCSKLLGRHAQN